MPYVEVKESFSTVYPTYVIAYCIDTNSWFITNQRHWYFQFEEEFKTEGEALKWIDDNRCKVLNMQNEMLSRSNQTVVNSICLESGEMSINKPEIRWM
jgi:hypothetical protein